jgi:hypothetical protein
MTGARHPRMISAAVPTIAEWMTALDWLRPATDFDAHGCAILQAVLSPLEREARSRPMRRAWSSCSGMCSGGKGETTNT